MLASLRILKKKRKREISGPDVGVHTATLHLLEQVLPWPVAKLLLLV